MRLNGISDAGTRRIASKSDKTWNAAKRYLIENIKNDINDNTFGGACDDLPGVDPDLADQYMNAIWINILKYVKSLEVDNIG